MTNQILGLLILIPAAILALDVPELKAEGQYLLGVSAGLFLSAIFRLEN